MRTYRIDFFDEKDIYSDCLLRRVYKSFADYSEARKWAESQNISKKIEINVCE